MNDATQTLAEQIHITVDYGRSLEAMIAAGHYNWANPSITAKRFPITGTGTQQVEVRLFHVGHFISSADALAAIKTANAENPWEPAKIEHLLAFGASNPNQQRHYPIVALGSAAWIRGGRRHSVSLVRDDRYVPYLRETEAKRHLNFRSWSFDWYGDFRFLTVRNRSSGV